MLRERERERPLGGRQSQKVLVPDEYKIRSTLRRPVALSSSYLTLLPFGTSIYTPKHEHKGIRKRKKREKDKNRGISHISQETTETRRSCLLPLTGFYTVAIPKIYRNSTTTLNSSGAFEPTSTSCHA